MARAKQSKSPAPKKKPAPVGAPRVKSVQKPRSQRLREKGRAAISLIRKRRATLADDFLDVGEALRVLKSEGMFEALGRADFDDVCARDLDLTESTVDAMIALSDRIAHDLERDLGRDRASALLALIDAVPADDRPLNLLDATLQLPTGGKLVVRGATAAEVREAARSFRLVRGAKQGKRSRGFTTTPDEKRRFTVVEKRWRARRDLASVVHTRLVASRREHGAEVDVRLPLEIWERIELPPAPKPPR